MEQESFTEDLILMITLEKSLKLLFVSWFAKETFGLGFEKVNPCKKALFTAIPDKNAVAY
jgi:hypothetical protein